MIDGREYDWDGEIDGEGRPFGEGVAVDQEKGHSFRVEGTFWKGRRHGICKSGLIVNSRLGVCYNGTMRHESEYYHGELYGKRTVYDL